MESVSGFHADEPFGSSYWNLISLETSGVNNTGGLTSTGGKFDADCHAGMNGSNVVFPDALSSISRSMGVFPADDSSSVESVLGLKRDAGFSVEWSAEEQYRLEEGLINFADESSIMTYIKIAATLPKKTVRDVALRCKWMMDKPAESSLKMQLPLTLPQNIAPVPVMAQPLDSSNCLLSHVPSTESRVWHVLEKNSQLFSQIRTNLSQLKMLYFGMATTFETIAVIQLQENRDLFACTRDNITTILNDIKGIPSLVTHMPPLPVSFNDDNAHIYNPL